MSNFKISISTNDIYENLPQSLDLVDRALAAILIAITIATGANGIWILSAAKRRYMPSFLQTLMFFGKFERLRVDDSNQKSKLDRNEDPDDKLKRKRIYFDLFDSIMKRIVVPKRWFRHFYLYLAAIWFAIVCRQLANSIWQIENHHVFAPNTAIVLTLLAAQAFRRIYETQKISIYSDNTINVLLYAVGHLFYTITGYATYRSIDRIKSGPPDSVTLSFVILFFAASALQFQSHVILARLRIENRSGKKSKTKSKSIIEDDYYIPQSGPFRYVACPHYLAEILIYFAFAILMPRVTTWQSATLLWYALFAFVVVNQTVAAKMAHNWYRSRFGAKFPSSRIRAIIPFIY